MDSGSSASGGTLVPSAPAPATAMLGLKRLAIQVLLCGAGNRAGSPSAHQINRPAASVKPPIGFQAACGLASMPNFNQPFQGKSFNFTVRMKMAELNPACASRAIFSMPAEKSAL